ncbi:hypothetical protein SCLARK_00811 [Spiroplasma clarkii]|uniref:Lipoprotein n=1 Tax=Spiroplasma clarkii TaxID=2139 RepID=A0A1Y0L0Y6_9MOLU|nr:lipoprotein [Spiroplasma clarkii]ARU91440.1 hypothetical protein SCLARK_00811 [Spiroplasma clarkii]ATX70857.1 hypothetical protein SCLAR_v1c05380 [Spiroplasma clarkii]
MKKLLIILTSTLLVTTSTVTVVACGADSTPDLDNWQDNNVEYELFGKSFKSKAEAVEHFMKNDTKIETSKNYKNEITLGNSSFKTTAEMLNQIESSKVISKAKTYKDPKNYLTDSLGSVSASGVVNKIDAVNVYQDVNGNAVYSGSDEMSKNDVISSYTNKIKSGYEADGLFFKSREQVTAYYQNKYEGEEIKLEQKKYHKLGNLWYDKESFENNLEKSIVKTVEYNGHRISEENKFNLSKLKLKESDLDKITKIEKRPGMYYLEAVSDDEGTLDIEGGNFHRTSKNIAELIEDKENWSLVSTSTEGLADAGFNAALSEMALSTGSIGFELSSTEGNSKPNKIINFFESLAVYYKKFNQYVDEISMSSSSKLASIFGKAASKSKIDKLAVDTEKVKAIFEKYQIAQEINALWNNLISFHSIDQNKKMVVTLHNIRELLRSLDVSQSDSNVIDEFMYATLLALNVSSFKKINKAHNTNNSDLVISHEWIEFVNDAKTRGELYNVLDLLMDSGYFTGKNNSANNSLGIKKTFDKFLDIVNIKTKDLLQLAKLYQKHLEDIGKQIKSTAEFAKILKKRILYVEAAITILNMIPGKTTENWEFVIPDTKNTIKYKKSSWFWEKNEFNPRNIMLALEIAKPKNTTTYLYNEKYFTSYAEAEYRMKRDIVDNLFADEKNIEYGSKYFEQIFETDKSKLLERISKLVEKMTAYSDGFGETFSNSDAAINSALRKISDQEFVKAYKYDYLGSYLYEYSYDAIYKKVLETIDLETKAVEFSDYLATNKFEKLENLDNDGYDLYQFKFNGKNYYFDNYNGAIVKYMHLNDYANVFIQVNSATYELNGLMFYNENQFQEYLLDNIKEVV